MHNRYSQLARFPSRRSAVLARRAAVASSHPLAAATGLDVLRRGGTAADAAVAAAAVLTVVEPMSTGLGGDAFALIYDPQTQAVRGLNASGRAPLAATIDEYRRRGLTTMPETGILSVTAPGAVDGWVTLLERYGTMPLRDLLAPAVEYAREGYAVSEMVHRSWRGQIAKLSRNAEAARVYMPDGNPPHPGDIFRQPDLARTLEAVAAGGRDAFYKGETAEKIVRAVVEQGGLLSAEDLARSHADWVEPIFTDYRGYRVYHCPPNGQGLLVLLGLNIMAGYDTAAFGFGSPQYMHLAIEAIKLALADAQQYVTDPEFMDVPPTALLTAEYAAQRRSEIRLDSILNMPPPGIPNTSDTVYLAVVDEDGLAVSFIQSLFHAFGSGIVVPGTGICLQNRGSSFRLDPNHRNALAPGKRPYHSIIPSIVTKDGELFLCYGSMGGMMQPQGLIQYMINVTDFGFNVQETLDAPRFRYVEGNKVSVETGFADATIGRLRALGHAVSVADPGSPEYFGFGGAQMIMRDAAGTLHAGSDPRKDGLAIGY